MTSRQINEFSMGFVHYLWMSKVSFLNIISNLHVPKCGLWYWGSAFPRHGERIERK